MGRVDHPGDGAALVIIYAPYAHLFGFESFEARHGSYRLELLIFFKARMLQAGYITAILAIAALYLISLFAPGYIGLVLPLGLAACLLVPSVVYDRLDHQAAADD
ncbi:MAG: hypothetical protein ACRD3E_19870 [Terriglobales bacterium]